ncbi:MAG: hypothetical protein Q8S16_08720 [Polaromonas sp.]|nr:hypothetical protein [Polaromonas sp.]
MENTRPGESQTMEPLHRRQRQEA